MALVGCKTSGGESQQDGVPEERQNFRSTRTRGIVSGGKMVASVGKGREENAGTAHLRSNEISLILDGTTMEPPIVALIRPCIDLSKICARDRQEGR